MTKGRLEAFSDGVLAIILTIMVLEMKVPQTATLAGLQPILPVFLSYLLSFIYIGIYWNNHHHMLNLATHVNGIILWANLHLLFWLSMFPFVTGWMGQNHFERLPVALYGIVATMSGIAYYILARCLAVANGKNSPIAKALGKDVKGIISVAVYLLGIGFNFVSTWLALAMYVVVAIIWFIPDKRMEKTLAKNNEHRQP